ncbi:MAG: hypothetical protein Q4B82_06870 [Alysiella sp.]|uniref:hypothetical protein n=1 Tax=Alysiella sp. TaxID=1872483 RepID=UPI0026DBDF74|nr:hypothetical protein [Alysiella sp.]MDO4434284.1 hypothetical protein [Alysiella sp.]
MSLTYLLSEYDDVKRLPETFENPFYVYGKPNPCLIRKMAQQVEPYTCTIFK